ACPPHRGCVVCVPLPPPVATIEAHAEAGERSAQAMPVRHQHMRAVLRPWPDLVTRAPVPAVAPAVNGPLGVLRPAAFDDGGLLNGPRHAGREHGPAAGPRP